MATANTDPFIIITHQGTLQNVPYNPNKTAQQSGGSLSPASLTFNSKVDISLFSASDIAKLTLDNIKNLTKIQQQNFGSEQAAALSGKQLAVLPLKYIPSESISAISIGVLPSLSIELLNTNQFNALTAAQIRSLTNKQMQSITLQQLSIISPEQAAVFDITDAGMFKSLSNFNSNAVNSLSIDFIKSLAPAVFSSFSFNSLTNLTIDQINVLSKNQIKALSATQISKLSDEQIGALSPNALSGLDKQNIKGLHISALTTDQVSILTSDQISQLTTSQISEFTVDYFQQLSPSAIKGLQANQMSAISEEGISAIDALGFSNLPTKSFIYLNPKQLKSITEDQFNYITSQQISALSSNQIAQLDQDIIQSLSIKALAGLGENIKGISIDKLDAIQFQALTTKQISFLTNIQIKSINENEASYLTSNIIKVLTPEQINSLSIEAIAAITPKAISALTTKNVVGLDVSQIKALTADQISALKPDNIKAFGQAQILALTNEAIQTFSTAAIKSISPAIISLLNADIFSNLSSSQIGSLTTAQIDSLTPEQISKFTQEQASGLKTDQISKFLANEANQFSADAIPAINISSIKVLNISGFNAKQISLLTSKQIVALTPNQLSSISNDALQGLTLEQLQSLSPTNFNLLYLPTENNTSKLNNTAISALDPKKLGNISTTTLEALLPNQVLALSPDAISWLTGTKKYHIVNNHILTDTVKPTLENASVNGNLLILTFNETLSNATAPSAQYEVFVASVKNSVSSATVSDKTITLNLATPVLNLQNVTVSYTDPSKDDDTNAIQDTAGNDVASLSSQTVTNNTPDVTAPVFANATVNGDALVLTYTDDNLLRISTLPINAFSVVDNNIINPVTAVSIDAKSKKITLTLTNSVINGEIVTVSYSDPVINNNSNSIQDEAGNHAASFSTYSVKNESPDILPPVFLSANVNGNLLTVSYTDSNLLSNLTPNTSAFIVNNDGVNNPVASVTVDTYLKKYTLKLFNEVKNAQLVTLTYTDPKNENDINSIQDNLGNDATSFTRAVTNDTLDVKPPIFASAIITNENGIGKLALIYIEANQLNTLTAPTSAFFVKTGGVINPVTSVSVDPQSKIVSLYLTNPVTEGQSVTFSYTDPSIKNDNNAIQDSAGNDALSIPLQSFNYSAADMSPPILTGLSIPLSIDVSKDPQTVTFTVKTIDDNSGTNNVTINFDNSLYYYSALNFGTSSSLHISVPVISQSGVYNIASIVVSDNAGNDRVYNTLDLKNIEMPTSFVVTRDSIAPVLNSLSLPLIIDLGNSSQSVDFSLKATDDSTGISRVYMSLDKSLSYSSGSDYLSFGNQTNLSRVIPQYIQNGIYNVTEIDVYDAAENLKIYTSNDLKSMGINTSFEVKNAATDTTAPSLLDLSLPSDVTFGADSQKNLNFTVSASDNNSGLHYVYVYLDKNLSYAGGGSDSLIYYGNTSSITRTIQSNIDNGTYSVTEVDVYDNAGNVRSYSPADLNAMNIKTSFNISGSNPSIPTPQDTNPPVLHSLTFPSIIDIGSGNSSVTFSADVTDDSYISQITVNFDDKLSIEGPQAVNHFDLGNNKISTHTVQTYSHAGTFNITSVYVSDSYGNSNTYSPTDLTALGIPTSFIVNNISDTTPPVFQSATVSSNQLVISYTEANSLSVITAQANAFQVKRNGNADVVNNIVIDSTLNTATLILADSVVHGDTMTFSYTDPTPDNDNNAIQDVAGNDAVSISNVAVTLIGI